MKYKRKDGLQRLKNRKYTPIALDYMTYPKVEESEDTKIRKAINKEISKMISENKTNIEIEICIRSTYPIKYAEYIAKMIAYHFGKLKSNGKSSNGDKTINGDERE